MNTKKITLISVLIVFSLIVSLLESYIPIPIPMVKLGISNVVILNSILIFGFKDSVIIGFLKSLILFLMISSPLSFFYSFFGTLSSIIVMYFSNRYFKIFSLVGTSVLGSVANITMQLFVASIFLKTFIVFYYFPIMAIFSVFTGIAVGLVSIRLYGILRGLYENRL